MFRRLVQSPTFLLISTIAIPIVGLPLGIDPPVLLGLLIGLHTASIIVSKAQARENARFWAVGQESTDEEFLRDCGIATDEPRAGIALAIRESIAELATVPRETIRAESPFRGGINTLPFWDSLDAMSFLLDLESRLDSPIPIPERVAALVTEAYKAPEFLVRDFVLGALNLLSRESS